MENNKHSSNDPFFGKLTAEKALSEDAQVGVSFGVGAAIGAAFQAVISRVTRKPIRQRDVLIAAGGMGIYSAIQLFFLRKPALDPSAKQDKVSIFARSTGGAIALGAITGGIETAAQSMMKRTPLSVKGTLINAGVVAGVFTFLHLLSRKTEKPSTTSKIIHADAPPVSPVEPAGEKWLALAKVPKILDLLVADGAITAEHKTAVLDQIKRGRTGFVGEIALADGFLGADEASARAKLDSALGRQGMMKAEAAVTDIQNIKDHGTLSVPADLRVNWGNNGVNAASAHPTRADGISAAAHAAQNLVIIANTDPVLAPELFDAVVAAASLANGIAIGDSPITPIAKMGDVWRKTMNEGLITAAKAHPELLKDANGKPVTIETYIAARDVETAAVLAEMMKHPPLQRSGHAR